LPSFARPGASAYRAFDEGSALLSTDEPFDFIVSGRTVLISIMSFSGQLDVRMRSAPGKPPRCVSFSNITTTTSQPSTSAAKRRTALHRAVDQWLCLAEYGSDTDFMSDHINRCAIDDPIRPVPHTPIFMA